jgi:glucose-1-phosphatase
MHIDGGHPVKTIKGIIWDFGNILARFNHLKACERLAKHSELSPEEIREALFKNLDAPAKRLEVGQLKAKDFFLEVEKAARLKCKLSFLEMSDMWQDIFEENEGVSTIISNMRPDIQKCICSNTDPIHWLTIERLPVMEKHFFVRQNLMLSYRMKTRKPDMKMYHEALGCMGFALKDIQHVLYIEDIAEYRDAFTALGGNVLAYDCSKDTISVLEDALRAYDVLHT